MNDNFQDIPERFKTCDYDDFCHLVQVEFGDMLKDLRQSRLVRYSGLKFRKKSVKFRRLLKYARFRSLEQEKVLNERFKKE
jgi:hypothetical protein